MRVTISLLRFVLLSFPMVAQGEKKGSISSSPQDCGSFASYTVPDGYGGILGYTCQRYGLFPWFAAQSVQNPDGSWRKIWETRTATTVGPSQTQGGVQYTWSVGDYSSVGYYNNVSSVSGKGLFGGAYGVYFVVVGETIPLRDEGSVRTDLFSTSACRVESGSIVCGQTEELAVGPLETTISGMDYGTILGTSLQLKYFNYDENGQVVSSVGVDPIFLDEASSKWVAAISETVPAKRGTADAEFTTFAVVNISEQPQSVLVSVYDTAGTLIYSVSTPILAAGTKDASHPGMIHSGGYYAAALSVGNDSLMGDKMFPARVFGDTFVGTIRFEGSAGGKIAPVVLNFRGKALSSCKVKAVVQ